MTLAFAGKSNTRRALLIIAAIVSVVAGALFGSLWVRGANGATDTTPPQLVAFDFNPKTVDVSSGPQTITFTAHITDDSSGVAASYAHLYAPSGTQNFLVRFDSDHRISGTALDGQYQFAATVPANAAAGAWSVYVFVQDAAGNYQYADLGAQSFPAALNVLSTTPDTAPPQITAFDFTPKSVDVSVTSQDVTFSAHLVDQPSGASTNVQSSEASYALFDSPSHSQWVKASFDGAHPSTGTAQDGTYQVNVTVPAHAEPGTWSVADFYLLDAIGNYVHLNPAAVSGLGLPTTFEVVSSAADTAAPTLIGFDFNPKIVDVGSSDQQITFTAHIADDISGVHTGVGQISQAYVSSPSNLQYVIPLFDGVTDRVSGTQLDGQFSQTVTIPAGAEAGDWKLGQLTLVDQAGNHVDLSGPQVAALGFPITLTVVNSTSGTGSITAKSMVSDGQPYTAGNGKWGFTYLPDSTDRGYRYGTNYDTAVTPMTPDVPVQVPLGEWVVREDLPVLWEADGAVTVPVANASCPPEPVNWGGVSGPVGFAVQSILTTAQPDSTVCYYYQYRGGTLNVANYIWDGGSWVRSNDTKFQFLADGWYNRDYPDLAPGSFVVWDGGYTVFETAAAPGYHLAKIQSSIDGTDCTPPTGIGQALETTAVTNIEPYQTGYICAYNAPDQGPASTVKIKKVLKGDTVGVQDLFSARIHNLDQTSGNIDDAVFSVVGPYSESFAVTGSSDPMTVDENTPPVGYQLVGVKVLAGDASCPSAVGDWTSPVAGEPDASFSLAAGETRTVCFLNGTTPSLKVTKTGTTVTGTGGAISWTVGVQNLGGQSTPDAKIVKVTDDLPDGLTGVIASGEGWDCPSAPIAGPTSGSTIVCSLAAPLDALAATPNIIVTAKAPESCGVITNVVSVNWGGEGTLDDSTAEASTNVPCPENVLRTLKVEKVIVSPAPDASTHFTGTVSSQVNLSWDTTNRTAVTVSSALAAGAYSVHEDARAGYRLLGFATVYGGSACPDVPDSYGAAGTAHLTGDDVSALVCVFDQPLVTIVAHKVEITDGNAAPGAGWAMALVGCGVRETGMTSANGDVVWSDEPPCSSYVVSEDVSSKPGFGFIPLSPTSVSINAVTAGGTFTASFTNARSTVITPGASPSPTSTATPTTPAATTPTVSPTTTAPASPSPTEAVAGEKTPGPAPAPPNTGNGSDHSDGGSGTMALATIAILLASATALSATALRRRGTRR